MPHTSHTSTWPSLWQATRYWLMLGFLSFGGPAGQIAMMHRELVERRRWISESRFLHALNYCMLLPGPEAQQLATYMGWLLHGRIGGIIAGGLFILPAVILLIVLSALYLSFGDLPAVQAVFDGIKPAALALIVLACWRIGQRTLKHPIAWVLASAALLNALLLGLPFPAVIALAASLGFIAQRSGYKGFSASGGHTSQHARLATPALIDDHSALPAHARHSKGGIAVLLGSAALLWAVPFFLLAGNSGLQQLASFFSKAALVTFGGAYAVLPYVFDAAVTDYQWMSAAQMLDGLALGESTPGPLIILVTYIGFLGGWQQAMLGAEQLLAGGIAGALVATWFTFLPSFVFILLGAPWVESSRQLPSLSAAMAAISAAVVGLIIHLALVFAWHLFWPNGLDALPELFSIVVTLLAIWLLHRRQWSILKVIGLCALLGLGQWGVNLL
ncbi:chromate efflux transporter [Atopomonas sediminilitoris]|uniref:chromate efflux transporter n=1 Tax=Atopomonas sediminilitoris TaxID=2919919 RepID=UPI001F4DDF7B|nr:chromate efflux transporter [Atopomonas sediminilitoris]MCJ8167908.1 chromate efflux transporter [Atopomonas sediminilitoris]